VDHLDIAVTLGHLATPAIVVSLVTAQSLDIAVIAVLLDIAVTLVSVRLVTLATAVQEQVDTLVTVV
jgi:hypothetical protein